jgi:nucleoid-associated protein YgaU
MAIYDASSRYKLNFAGREANRGERITGKYTLYTVVSGDTLENIAMRRLGSPTRYWEIADMNPQIKFPTDIETGDVIRIPL